MKVTAIRNLIYNGKIYKSGETLEVSESQAQTCAKRGLIEGAAVKVPEVPIEGLPPLTGKKK